MAVPAGLGRCRSGPWIVLVGGCPALRFSPVLSAVAPAHHLPRGLAGGGPLTGEQMHRVSKSAHRVAWSQGPRGLAEDGPGPQGLCTSREPTKITASRHSPSLRPSLATCSDPQDSFGCL